MTTMPRLQDFDDPDYDPFASDAEHYGDHIDPNPILAEWRKEGSVLPGSYRSRMGMPSPMYPEGQYYTVVGTAEVNTILTDLKRFSNSAYSGNIGATFGMGALSVMDQPDHGRWRRIFQKIFLPQYVKTWGETIVDPVVNGLMDQFLGRGEADLIGEFTIRYPFQVIYRQLALPVEDEQPFQRLAIAQTDYAHADKAIEAGRLLGEYFKALVAYRRENPGDDLVSLLANTEVDGEHLPELVLISFLRQLMNAAGDTTYRGTSVLLTALLSNPDQLEAIRQDRSLIPDAIEEALRWDGPVNVALRTATEDMELGGVHIAAGTMLDAMTGAANRDPAIFENPEKFDIFRPKKAHWAFARGPHICVGQHLARVEMTRAMIAILDHMPNLRFDPDRPQTVLRGAMMRVPAHLYIRFDTPRRLAAAS